MKLNLNKILIANLLLSSVILLTNAQTAASSANTLLASNASGTVVSNILEEEVATSVDITLPLKTSDFLMFYGITNNKDSDSAISDLRKDFIKKFNTLKEDYNNNLIKITENKNLIPPANLKESASSTNIKANTIKKYLIQNPNKKINSLDKEIINTNNISNSAISTSSEEVLIPTIVNVLNADDNKSKYDGTIHIKNKGWFSKLKSLFGL